ncbi:hypothetical protein ATL31_2014 [Phycicoccus duodecadis]|uniref:Dolichyl-phosphate-mannose-protein mannosyltransferase n=1 Tax=Phycicoccus duodecadis TaxID=173053 RepID=A0A2N3YK00_9MICO|nr:hypothetical protein ATL31_2014 [Phycicoccus duodecadis]
MVTVVVRLAEIIALKIGAEAQSATGPATPDGVPGHYFVYSPSPASPGLGAVLGNWDGEWYERIAMLGYPRGDEIASANDAYVSGFPPGFPLLARVTTEISGLSFVWSSVLLNTVLSLATVVLLHGLLRSRGLPARVAAVGAAAVSLLPSSPVLVAAYSEPLALLFLVVALRLILEHRYLVAAVAILGLALTRPVAVAFVPVLLIHAVLRFRVDRRLMPARSWATLSVATLVAAASPWVWPRVAVWIYGRSESVANSGASRTDQIASGLGSGYLRTTLDVGGPPALVLLALAFLALVGVPAVVGLRTGWPVELLAWGAAYLAMVIIATPITPGFLRYLVLAAPLFGPLFAAPFARMSRPHLAFVATLTAACLWAQWFWIRYLFILDPAPALLPWSP